MKGTVYGTTGGVYRVLLDDGGYVESTLRGRLKKDVRQGDRVVIGDRVRLEGDPGSLAVTERLPRASELTRRGVGIRRPKVVAANLDRVFVVLAAVDPAPHLEVIDRLLAVVESCRLPAVLVVNKVDLPGGAEAARSLAELYGPVGYEVLSVSAESGAGLEEFAALLRAGTSALIGPSGVGKSTLLNAVDPDLDLRTGEVSARTGTGKHTTVGSRLIPLAGGGRVADTPGFGDVGVWGLEPEEVERCFPEFEPFLDECRFRSCAHLREPDCAVRAALAEGTIPESRYASYVTLREEAVSASAV
ncbi:MAG: ribosome small subunit-dependent GTPase A [Gemmatimonadota bacterium]|nr:ribosome small subunit-dependent GTPase A [Gemmatimonadota bacterium]MDH5759435.1 ribosome small subunit-dependent GTPase A [Gemmatimonadota bacterium]